MSKGSKVANSSSSTEVTAGFGVKEIKTILELLSKHEVSEFQLEKGDDRLWLKRGPQSSEPVQAQPSSAIHQVFSQMPSSPAPVIAGAEPTSVPATGAPQAVVAQATADVAVVEPAPAVENYSEVSSPMVGTFYKKPAVDADPYVRVGDYVKAGDVLCIVEAMKLMNEIESDVSGKIVEICLEDGQMVEYGETLFKIEAE